MRPARRMMRCAPRGRRWSIGPILSPGCAGHSPRPAMPRSRHSGFAYGTGPGERTARRVPGSAPRLARAGSPLSARRRAAAGQRVLPRSGAARRCGAAGRAGRPAAARHRRHAIIDNEPGSARRLLALCAGILHAGPRLAAGRGAARRKRHGRAFLVELAARRAQPRRDPGCAHRRRPDLGAARAPTTTRRTSRACWISCAAMERRSERGCCSPA